MKTETNLYDLFHPSEITEYNSHLPHLWDALEATTGDVLELGMGEGSTLQLHEYCEAKGRKLTSVETNPEWYAKYTWLASDLHTIQYYEHWYWATFHANKETLSVVLVDHAPGHRRGQDVIDMKDIPGILVCHDSEPQPTLGTYGYEAAWPHFKYVHHYDAPMKPSGHNGVWTTVCSNSIDVKPEKDE